MADIDEDRILQVLQENKGDYAKTAKITLVPATRIRDIDIVRNKKYNYTPEGRGPKHLQKYIVDIIKVYEAWDNKKPAIRAARESFNKGESEMVTGRDGLNMILYSIPRKNKINRKK